MQDTNMQFDLAIECSNLEVAMETESDRPCGLLGEIGATSSQAGQSQACMLLPFVSLSYSQLQQIVEKAYQQTKNFDKLSFLCLAIGSTNKTSMGGLNWPSVSAGEDFFDCMLASGKLEGGIEPTYANGDVAGAVVSSALDAWAREEVHGEIDPEEGWELDTDGEELRSEHGDEVAADRITSSSEA
jgi:Coatomer WD associated region